jgi:hypothetical protein
MLLPQCLWYVNWPGLHTFNPCSCHCALKAGTSELDTKSREVSELEKHPHNLPWKPLLEGVHYAVDGPLWVSRAWDSRKGRICHCRTLISPPALTTSTFPLHPRTQKTECPEATTLVVTILGTNRWATTDCRKAGVFLSFLGQIVLLGPLSGKLLGPSCLVNCWDQAPKL